MKKICTYMYGKCSSIFCRIISQSLAILVVHHIGYTRTLRRKLNANFSSWLNTNVNRGYARTFFGHSLIGFPLRLCGDSSRRRLAANNRYRSVRRTRLTMFLIFNFNLCRGFAQLTARTHIIWIRSLTFAAYIA